MSMMTMMMTDRPTDRPRQSSVVTYMYASRIYALHARQPENESSSAAMRQCLNYSATGGGSLEARGLKGRSSSPMGREQMGFPTADQGFSSIQDTLFGFYGI